MAPAARERTTLPGTPVPSADDKSVPGCPQPPRRVGCAGIPGVTGSAIEDPEASVEHPSASNERHSAWGIPWTDEERDRTARVERSDDDCVVIADESFAADPCPATPSGEVQTAHVVRSVDVEVAGRATEPFGVARPSEDPGPGRQRDWLATLRPRSHGRARPATSTSPRRTFSRPVTSIPIAPSRSGASAQRGPMASRSEGRCRARAIRPITTTQTSPCPRSCSDVARDDDPTAGPAGSGLNSDVVVLPDTERRAETTHGRRHRAPRRPPSRRRGSAG